MNTLRTVLACMLVMSVMAGCGGAPWSVRLPARPPAGSIVACQTDGRVASICGFTPPGDLLVWTFDKRLVLLDPDTGLRKFEVAITDAVSPAAFHPTGAVIVVGSLMAELWDFSADPPRRTLDWRVKRYPGRSAFSPDGSLLAMGDYRIGLWAVSSGRKLREVTIPPEAGTGHGRPTGWIGFSPDGKVLAATARGKRTAILFWSVADGALLRSLELDLPADYGLHPLGMSADGGTIVLRESHQLPSRHHLQIARSTRVYDTATGRRLLHLSVRARICNGGRMIVEWPEDTPEMRLYDLATGRLLRTLPAVNHPVIAGPALAATFLRSDSPEKRHYGFWDLDSGKMTSVVSVAGWYEGARALSPDARFLVVGQNSQLCIISRDSGNMLLDLNPKRHLDFAWGFHSLLFSSDSTRLAFIHDGVVGVANLRLLDPRRAGENVP